MAEPIEFKKIIREVIGTTASDILLNRLDKVLDEAGNDIASLKQACIKIEKTVTLFVGTDAAQALERRLSKSLSRVE